MVCFTRGEREGGRLKSYTEGDGDDIDLVHSW